MQELMSFDEYERDWLRKHRGSIPRKRRVSTTRGWFWITFWIVVAVGAAVYSAAHTIPAAELTILQHVPNRSELALSVFTIVELLIFGAAAKRHDIYWLRYVMIGAVLVALVSNVGSSVLAVSINGGNLLNQLAGVLLSILAPMSALAAGEVLHIEQDKRDAAGLLADAEYDKAVIALNTRINKDYNSYVKEHTPKPVHEISREDFMKSGERKQTRVKLHEVAKEIHENGDSQLTTEQMMEKYNISMGSTSRVREILKAQNGNGYHQ